ncbi:MAG: hypothetical protein H6953_09550 [Chromatiaceae bacterium]|nr:hypothetical protein [Gammaproteobacteria bacterium]MCP5305681.1 hypothetical protein [Chromatiaceae bacterium]MCP5312538.1 hypothetical protein [Chromatiaceae bacterium]
MAEEIKRPNGVAVVLPPNASRGTGQQQRRRPDRGAPKRDRSDRERRPDDDQPHRVDEYV